jgi:hypothetical protein
MKPATLATVGTIIVALAGCKDDPPTASQAPPPQAAATQPAQGGQYWQVPVIKNGRLSEVMVFAEDAEGAVRRAIEMRYPANQIERLAVRLATPAEVQKHKEMLRLIEQSKPPAASAAAGERSGPPRDPWAGFDIGSWVVLHEKQVADGKVEERKTKFAIAEYRPGSPSITETSEVGGEFGGDPQPSRVHVSGFIPGDGAVAATRNETLTLGGRKVECTVNEHVQESEKGGRKKLVVWRAAGAKVPYRELAVSGRDIALDTDVVKAEYSFQNANASGVYTVEVTRFDEKLKVGDKEVPCVVEKGTGKEEGDRAAVVEVTRWLSDEVPGREVRFVGKATVDGKVYEPEKRVVDFKAIKRSE